MSFLIQEPIQLGDFARAEPAIAGFLSAADQRPGGERERCRAASHPICPPGISKVVNRQHNLVGLQLTLEQRRAWACGSTHTRVFSIVTTTVLHGPLTLDAEEWAMWRAY